MKYRRKLLVIVLFVVIASNVFVSQKYPEDLFDVLLSKDRAKSLDLLINIRKNGDFNEQLLFLNWYTGHNYLSVFDNQNKQEYLKISQIESLLAINPNQPEVLYLLSREYKKVNGNKKAEELIKRARKIDPLKY